MPLLRPMAPPSGTLARSLPAALARWLFSSSIPPDDPSSPPHHRCQIYPLWSWTQLDLPHLVSSCLPACRLLFCPSHDPSLPDAPLIFLLRAPFSGRPPCIPAGWLFSRPRSSWRRSLLQMHSLLTMTPMGPPSSLAHYLGPVWKGSRFS